MSWMLLYSRRRNRQIGDHLEEKTISRIGVMLPFTQQEIKIEHLL